jgi:hypothetical protein
MYITTINIIFNTIKNIITSYNYIITTKKLNKPSSFEKEKQESLSELDSSLNCNIASYINLKKKKKKYPLSDTIEYLGKWEHQI